MKIASLLPSQNVKGRWLLTFEDGTKLKITDREMVDFSLYAGLDVPESALEQLKDAAGESQARRRAANILSSRPLSRQALEKRLVEQGETPRHAAAACDHLESLGYLNDEQYAKQLAQYYVNRGCGPRKIRDELHRRGVPRELWDQALEGVEETDEALDRFIQTKLKRVDKPDRKDLKRVTDALLRRGHSWSDISAALRRYTDSIDDWGEDSP